MFDFSKVVDRHGTWCTQWDYVADRFGKERRFCAKKRRENKQRSEIRSFAEKRQQEG